MEVCDPRVGVSYVTVMVMMYISSGLPADRERNVMEGSLRGSHVSFPTFSEDQAFLQLCRGESSVVSPSECVMYRYQLQQMFMSDNQSQMIGFPLTEK
jgi:hypothetical protein